VTSTSGIIVHTPWWKRKLIWGVSISILLGVLSLVVNRGEENLRFAALLALTGSALATGLELRFRFEEITAAQSSQAVEQSAHAAQLAKAQAAFDLKLQNFTTYVQAPPSCQKFLADIAEDWHHIEEKSSVFLGWLRQDAEREFRTRLHELAGGHGVVDQRSRHYFRSHPLQDFAQIRSINAKTTGYWNSARGRRYVESQRTAIASNGLAVSRIFVLNSAEIASTTDIVRIQVQAGIIVSIVVREEIESDPDVPKIEDLSLVTDRTGVTGVLRPGSPDEPETFTTEEHQVAAAEYVLDALTPYTHHVDEIYAFTPEPSRSSKATSPKK
jgi:hypothetical protein